MDSKSFVKNYWNYYIELEKQVLETSRYVDFSAQNNATYSIEYLQLILAIGSEIDVVSKIISSEKYSVGDSETINTWGRMLESILPDMPNVVVSFNDDYNVQPWEKWFHESATNKKGQTIYKLKNGCANPKWWTEYNKVKHQRTSSISKNNKRTYYTRACLRNVIYALAGLWVIESEYLNMITSKEAKPYSYSKSILYKKK